jgi:ligand-binding sensor domain-containing protein/signal transduction histidine kinase
VLVNRIKVGVVNAFKNCFYLSEDFLKMRAFRFFIVNCLLLFCINALKAQPYFFTNYTSDDGLSDNSVDCIVKDKDGYIWIGTEAGLNRFNGYDFTVYKSLASDSTTIASNTIHALLADANGNLWIGTTNGICLYDKENNSFIRVKIRANGRNIIGNYETFRFLEDSHKNVWAGVSDFGLLKYDNKQRCFIQALKELPVLSNKMVNGLAEDKDGTLWLSNYNELLNYNPKTNSLKEFKNILPVDGSKFQALNIFKDQADENFLWIATWGSGLVHFDKRTSEFNSYKFQPNGTKNLHNIVFEILHLEKNKLWLATSEGIIIFNNEKKIYEGYVRDSIHSKTVVNVETHCIFKDDEGIMWIGAAGGLCNIHPSKQNFVNQPLWMSAPSGDYYFDEANDKLYGTRIYKKRVLSVYSRKLKRQTEFPIPQADEIDAEPFTVIKDDLGTIWIGTSKGIYTFDERKAKFTLLEFEDHLHIPNRAPYIRSSIKTHDGKLWFAYYSLGLIMIDEDAKGVHSFFHNSTDKTSYPLYAVTGMAEGKENIVYACDEKRGVAIVDYKRNSIIHYNAEEKKYSLLKNATGIAVDMEDCIWVATRNNGLVRIDTKGEVVAYTKDDFGNIIDEQSTIAVDESGKVWLTANNGIYCFNPKTKSFTIFTLQDGLPLRSVPLRKLPNGKIAINLPEGIFCFDPGKISKTSKRLQVHLTSLLINGKPSKFNNTVDQLDKIELLHSENNLTIEFAATDFAHPNSTLYRYKLEGIDNNWSPSSKTRVVNFSQLPPGDFTLLIQAGNNSPIKKLLVSIIPAWYQTGFFKWTVSVLAIVFIFISVRFFTSLRYKQQIAKLEQQRQIENIRTRISRDIHDEIGSGLTKIKLMSRNLTKVKQPVEISEATSKISNASDELIQNLAEIVWTVNPSNDTLENVFAYARNYVSKTFDEHTDIKPVINFTEPAGIPHNVFVNPEIKRNVLLILKEALTNVIKHADAKEVYVSLEAEKSALRMKIVDNGKGISENRDIARGNGLKNMRKRAESVKGEIDIQPNPLGGTSIHVFIPLKEV